MGNFVLCLHDGSVFCVLPQRQSFSAYPCEIRNSDESQDGAEILLLMIQRRNRTVCGIDPTTRRDDERFLAFRKQPFGACRTILECPASDDYTINPGFELCGNREIVHRRADNDDIGCQKLIYISVASRQIIGKCGICYGRTLECRHMLTCQIGHGICCKITIGDGGVGMCCFLLRDGFSRKLAA